MKTLSVKQPWAYLLCSGIKDIENRTWKLPEKYKGERVLIHASAQYELFSSLSQEQVELLKSKGIDKKYLIDKGRYFTSAVIGSVRFVDCMINHQSIWAEKSMKNLCPLCGRGITNLKIGRQWCEDCRRVLDKGLNYDSPIYNWKVEDPKLFEEPILNVKGKLNFWDYDLGRIAIDAFNMNR